MKDSKTKIAFVIPNLGIGGVETNFLNLSNNLAEKFSKIEIVYHQEIDDGTFKDKFQEKISLIKLKTLRSARVINEYRIYYNSSKPTIIIVSMYVVAFQMIIARIFSKHKPIIIINGGNHFSSFTNKSENFKEKYLLPYFAKVAFKYANFSFVAGL